MVRRRLDPVRRLWLGLLAFAVLAGCAALPAPGGPQVRRDIAYGPAPAHRLDLYRPAGGVAGGRPLILFFHGGFWQMGSRDSLENHVLARDLAGRGAIVLVVGYRLHPEAHFPDFLRDGALAVAWARAHAAEVGGDPDAIFVAGHSAGAYIAVMLALDATWLAEQGLSTDDLAGAIGISGPYGGSFTQNPAVRLVFDGRAEPAAMLPETFIRADAPPLLLLCGGLDAVVPPSQMHRMAARMAAAGGEAEPHVYPGIDHLGILMSLPWLPSLAPTTADIMRFVERRRAGRDAAPGAALLAAR